MTTLLKRLSLNIERKVQNSSFEETPNSRMPQTHSFNDFSLHINQDGTKPYISLCRSAFQRSQRHLFYIECLL